MGELKKTITFPFPQPSYPPPSPPSPLSLSPSLWWWLLLLFSSHPIPPKGMVMLHASLVPPFLSYVLSHHLFLFSPNWWCWLVTLVFDPPMSPTAPMPHACQLVPLVPLCATVQNMDWIVYCTHTESHILTFPLFLLDGGVVVIVRMVWICTQHVLLKLFFLCLKRVCVL